MDRPHAESAVIRAITLGEVEYPAALARICDPPPTLWIRGRPEALHSRAVAVVGSRAASRYAIDVAERLAHDLARAGVVVVSGLARGVDSSAHRGALDGGGPTVAVLGSGCDVIYPPEHLRLAREIEREGALVSEQPPGTPARGFHFPLRNRIISGLSRAVVVVEASEHSGSLITARAALDQGREVMAVPGNVLSGRNRGSHGLLKDGAKIVESVDDILEELGWLGGPAEKSGRPHGRDPLLQKLDVGDEYEFDTLVELTGISAPKLLPRLLELELGGAISRVAGGRFVRLADSGNVRR